jgi:hypothetical protein
MHYKDTQTMAKIEALFGVKEKATENIPVRLEKED